MSQDAQHESKAGVDLGRVRAALAPVLSAHGVDLVELEWTTERAGWILRITIERIGSTYGEGFGVTLDDCAEVSRDASSVLDVEDLIPHRYNLEVSSPGLDRPLRTPAEFSRFVGQTAKVKLSRPAPDGQRVLRGPLAEAPEGKVAVVVDGKRIEVPFTDVAEANLVFELSPQPKKAAKPAKKKAHKGEKKPHHPR
jgi:ribosome maturation factor RimP